MSSLRYRAEKQTDKQTNGGQRTTAARFCCFVCLALAKTWDHHRSLRDLRGGSRNFYLGRPVKGPSKFWVGQNYVGQNFVWVGQARVWVGHARPTRPNSQNRQLGSWWCSRSAECMFVCVFFAR